MKVQEAMKQTIQFDVAIAVCAAAMFAYMYEPPPDRVVQEVGQAAPTVSFLFMLRRRCYVALGFDDKRRVLERETRRSIAPAVLVPWTPTRGQVQHQQFVSLHAA